MKKKSIAGTLLMRCGLSLALFAAILTTLFCAASAIFLMVDAGSFIHDRTAVALAVLACALTSFFAAKKSGEHGLLLGSMLGLFVFLVLFVVSFILNGSPSLQALFVAACLILSGAVGGLAGVYSGYKKKIG